MRRAPFENIPTSWTKLFAAGSEVQPSFTSHSDPANQWTAAC
ncbi:hypothetical protein SAMN04488012_11924 [Palleronia salina]|uniref:Uncharacterized protein n=1 Tax=Palleronia salina TaxID=313368 RepID=A0A1M6M361_9RHOB|nr:hypothetical protein SAMN04488012_11924 [Palleronia salina]